MTLMSSLVVNIGDLHEERTIAIRHHGCSIPAQAFVIDVSARLEADIRALPSK
jgi:hypothetical protein